MISGKKNIFRQLVKNYKNSLFIGCFYFVIHHAVDTEYYQCEQHRSMEQ